MEIKEKYEGGKRMEMVDDKWYPTTKEGWRQAIWIFSAAFIFPIVVGILAFASMHGTITLMLVATFFMAIGIPIAYLLGKY